MEASARLVAVRHAPQGRPAIEYGPLKVKASEIGVKYGPATISIDHGNPKASVKVSASLVEGGDVEAEVEAKASLLANSNPYSAGIW
jgi:hypothetical protein